MESLIEQLQSIRFKNYKSFRNDIDYFHIPMDQLITIIIGRNNCGKSSLIDIVETVMSNTENKYISELGLIMKLKKELLDGEFSENDIVIDYEIGKNQFINDFASRNISLDLVGDRTILSNHQEDSIIPAQKEYYRTKHSWEIVAGQYSLPMGNTVFRRINADRDIIPEKEDNSNRDIDSAGNGMTNILRRFVNDSSFDETVVENVILTELNKIMEEDGQFSAIRIQQEITKNNEYYWEIYLVENGKRYALSKCGSGLKTILLILANLYLIPKLDKKNSNTQYVFAFEEIENNLHPALQRRLFEYLYKFSLDNKIRIILTTHSHVAINTFYGRESTQILHVQKKQGISSLTKINDASETKRVLDNLGVQASDLFQTNGILWVEGPSDRIYILKWLEVFCHNRFIEGQHYQFMYYGGRLLAHYEASEERCATDNLINMLTINHNALIVMDSDRKKAKSHINETKRRVRDEFDNLKLLCWITKGKEIENYVSADAVNSVYGSTLSQIGEYELFPDYISKQYKSFTSNKVECARKYAKYITKDNSENILDLKEKIEKVYKQIEKWNEASY